MSAVMPPLEDFDAPDDGFFPPPSDREVAQLRVPPHSVESESGVLGGLLLVSGHIARYCSGGTGDHGRASRGAN